MPRTRRSSMMGLAQRLNDKSPKKESNVTVTPKKAGKKKNKRTVSDRSPANAARKKASTENTMNHSRVDDVEDKENRTPVRSPEPVQKATPYWKVAEERGTSPRVTRSVSKRPRDFPHADDVENSEVSKGLFQHEFSPPDPAENRKRELRMEKERDARLNQQRRQEGDVAFLSPNCGNASAKDDTSQNKLCLEMSPDANFPADRAMVRTSSVSSPITYTSSHFDELKTHCHEVEKVNASLRTENTMLHTENTMLNKTLAKAEQSLEKIGFEKERLIIEKSKLEGQANAFLNPEWNKGSKDMICRVEELEENVGKFNSTRTESEARARLEELEREIHRFRKALGEKDGEIKKQLAENEASIATAKKGADEVASLKSQLDARNSDLSRAEERNRELESVHQKKGADEVASLKAQLDARNSDLSRAEEYNRELEIAHQKKGADEVASLKAQLDARNSDLSRAEERNRELEITHQKKDADLVALLKDQLDVKTSDLARAEECNREHEIARQNEQKEREAESKSLVPIEKLSHLEAEIEELCEQHEVDERTIEGLRSEIASVKDALSASQEEIKLAEEKLNGSTEKNIELVTKINRLTQENQSYKDEIEALRGELEKYVQECSDLKILLDDSTREANEIKSGHHELKMALTTATSENLEKEKRIAKMMGQMSSFNGRETELLQNIILQEEVRRSLHNRVMQLSGNIRVFIRVRPCIPKELAKSENRTSPFSFPSVFNKEISASASSVNVGDDLTKRFIVATEPLKDRGGLSQRRKRMKFGFDNVFNPNSNQEDVWGATEPLVQSAVDGYNVCVFAYGQTGSGKTYTMLGGGTASNPGLVTKSIQKLFDAKKLLEDTSHGETKAEISIELLEVYNEQVRDLMSTQKNGQYKSLNISFSNEAVGNVIFPASDENEVFTVLAKAQERRCVKATDSNEESSRSHLLITMNFVIKNASGVVRKSKLHICDLAGSERLSKSHATGSTLNETKHINKSLSILSNVIEKLQHKSKHVPFRESKLTYLLRNSLGGDSKTLAIVCCNPLAEHFQETSCSLRFAQKLNKVELQAMGNISC